MYTTDVISNVALGVKNNTFEDEQSLFFQITNEMFSGGLFDNIKFYLALSVPQLTPYLGLR